MHADKAGGGGHVSEGRRRTQHQQRQEEAQGAHSASADALFYIPIKSNAVLRACPAKRQGAFADKLQMHVLSQLNPLTVLKYSQRVGVGMIPPH